MSAKIVVRIPVAQYQPLYEHVCACGTNMSAFTRQAILEKMDRDNVLDVPLVPLLEWKETTDA